MKNKNLTFVIIAGILVVILGLLWAFQGKKEENGELVVPETPREVVFTCSEEKMLEASFGDKLVVVALGDGRRYTLEERAEAAGIYSNDGNQIVFWNSGRDAYLEENGQKTFEDCVQNLEEKTVSGEIKSIDLEQATYDGPIVLVIEGNGETNTIAVPSMGINLCPAQPNIANVYNLKAGDRIEVKGSLSEEGRVVPCTSEAHYLRVSLN